MAPGCIVWRAAWSGSPLLLLLLTLNQVETLQPWSSSASLMPRDSSTPPHDAAARRSLQCFRPLPGGMQRRWGSAPSKCRGCLRIRGGGAFEDDFMEQPVKCQHDIEYDSEGWYRHGDYLFRSKDQAHRLLEEPFCVKVAGSVISPFNWKIMLKSLLAGRPQRTVGMRRIRRDENAVRSLLCNALARAALGEFSDAVLNGQGPLVMIDGADDIATALQGSGVPQQLRFAMQAFVLYPLVLPIVEFGFRGAEDDHVENRAEAAEARDEVLQHKTAFIEDLCALEKELGGSDSKGLREDLGGLHASRAQAAADGGSSWGRSVRWMVSAQGTKLPREWRDHVEDQHFLERGKAVIRRLAGAPGAMQRQAEVERLVRRLAVLDGVVRKAWEPRLRANLTSPLAMFACAGMWWAMLLHELAAFGGFLGRRRWMAVGEAARGLADWILPASQGFMALYGASVGVAGVREASELGENLVRIESSKSLQGFTSLRASMRYQLEALRASNAMAEIVAGPALFFGQALMALGGPSLMANLWVLLLGSALTAFSIVIKIFVDLDTERRFGYNDDALDVAAILLDDVPHRVPSGSPEYEPRALSMIQDRRVVYLRELSWIKVLSLLHKTAAPDGGVLGWLRACFSTAFSCMLPPPSAAGGTGELLAGAHSTYRERYDTELHGMLQAILADRKVGEVLQQALPMAGDPLFISFLFLSVLEGIRPSSPSGPSAAGSDKSADAAEQLQVLAVAERLSAALERWTANDRASNMEEVLGRLDAQGLTAPLHEAVLDSMMVKASWGKQVERWHRPFIEVVDCWEERTLKVPGILRLLHLWTVKHVKQAYRFLPDAFLKLYRDSQGESAVHTGRLASGVESVRRVAAMIGKATWRVVEVHRKFQDRSELGCLNEALLELLRQRELRTSLVTPPQASASAAS